MHLTLNVGYYGGSNLIWSKYEGFQVETYNIWRGSNIDNMFLIGSVTGSNFTFTDLYPQAGTNIYQVEVISPYSCNPDNLKALYHSSFSNPVYRYPAGIEDKSSNMFHIYPNPTSDNVMIEFPNLDHADYKLILTDLTGKVIILMNNITEHSIEIDLNDLSTGLYLVELRGPNTFRGKIVIE